MNKYTDEKINIEDLKLLKSILSSDKEKLEKQIIDSLGKIHALTEEYANYGEALEKESRYKRKRRNNVLKSGICTFISLAIAEAYYNNNPAFLYEACCFLSGTVLGYNIFQISNRKENGITDKDMMILNMATRTSDSILDNADVYFVALKQYLNSKENYVIKDEIKKMFELNSEYIKNKIDEGKFHKNFSFEKIVEITKGYLDDDNVKKIFISLEKDEQEEKQRKR